MRIDTNSGLHGALVEYVSTAIDYGRAGFDGYAILKRDDAPVAHRPFSTHLLYTDPDGNQYAESGHYDLTLREAQADLRERVGRVSPAEAWREGLASADYSFEDGEIYAVTTNPYEEG